MNSLIDRLRAHGVLPTALELGFSLKHGSSIAPCPACQAEQRSVSSNDSRGPIGLTRDGQGWRCHRCKAGGGAVTLVEYVICGRKLSSGDRSWRDVIAACGRMLDGESFGSEISKTLIDKRALREFNVAQTKRQHRPPPDEVQCLWGGCVPVTAVPEVRDWLLGRQLDPEAVEWFDLARALPSSFGVPDWARCRGQLWTQGGWRLVVPLFDAFGALQSLHARFVGSSLPEGMPKGAMPRGFAVAGLVLADASARWILQSESDRATEDPTRVLVVEGVPDFLKACGAIPEWASAAPAVLGVLSGSWTPELAKRIPERAVVSVATHSDEAGEDYARSIADSLLNRCTVYRVEPHKLRGCTQ